MFVAIVVKYTSMGAMRIIFIAANQREPYICRSELGPWYCVLISALELICRLRNYKCIIREVPRKGLKNEHLDGVLGALTNQTADVGIAALGMTYNRAKYHHYVPSFFSREYSVLISKNKLEHTYGSYGVVVSPSRIATWDVWLTVIITLFFITGCIVLLRRRLFAHYFMYTAFLLFGATLNQDDIRPPTGPLSGSVRALLLLWLCWSFIITTMFTSTMSYIFTVLPNKALPFTNFETLLSSGFQVETTSQAQQFLNNSINPMERSVARIVTVSDDKKQWIGNIQRMQIEDKFATMVGDDVFAEIGNYSKFLIDGRCHPQLLPILGGRHYSPYVQARITHKWAYWKSRTALWTGYIFPCSSGVVW
ncbi:uncharacterized protein LOC129585938 isoform X2 [Paramacrobiotus metropolitanus]|uniref:uncharacterized protein LOC129585938 isoform X2 n=1 Tax=Paramacrobiotus metropolitanus TaxID=2943436 RepID=UPI00244578E2|nr:uncharacterized protein LOC129585938 isoform X2 [Paramacrobiotus metropolitanus]